MYTDLNNDGKVATPTEILWEGQYYPYGLAHKGAWMDTPDKDLNYKYNGIELADDFGLNVNLATFRTLDPATGRWWQVDPKAEWGYHLSPYNSMQNNPISYSDPEGDWIHIAVGAVIGGVINTATHWDDIQRDGLWAGVKAFGIGAGAGALTAATGGAAVGAGFAGGAAIGAGSGIAGDILLQTGNAVAFGDQYNASQTLWAGGLGALGGGLTGHFTKANPAAVPRGPTAEVFDEFIDPYAVHSVSGGGNIVKTGGALDDIAFSAGFTDEFVVTASRLSSTHGSLFNAGNILNKNGLSAFGRALQKHGSRAGSKFPQAKGNPAAMNAQGESVFRDILNNPDVRTITRHHARFGNILEYKLPNGMGARFSRDLNKFFGFIE